MSGSGVGSSLLKSCRWEWQMSFGALVDGATDTLSYAVVPRLKLRL